MSLPFIDPQASIGGTREPGMEETRKVDVFRELELGQKKWWGGKVTFPF